MQLRSPFFQVWLLPHPYSNRNFDQNTLTPPLTPGGLPPLLPMADGSFGSFGPPASPMSVYVVSEAEMILFLTQPLNLTLIPTLTLTLTLTLIQKRR